jgi:hypothetical protein
MVFANRRKGRTAANKELSNVVPQTGRRSCAWFLLLLLFSVIRPESLTAANAKHAADAGNSVLWVDPGDIKSRNLFFGPGGESNQPQLPVKFLKEDLNGTSPKFDVRDEAHKKWKAKLGVEAQPETVATRLLWAVGYFANVNYFFPTLKIKDLPHLRRGQEFVGPDDEARAVRLQQHPGDEKKAGTWNWHRNPFVGTREFNGLRVMMALFNNWDLKDENNAIFDDPDHPERKIYEVTDVGASFGPAGESYSNKKSKASLPAYRHAKFISKATSDHVDFNFPTHLPFVYVFNAPHFFSELHNHSIGKHIPRSDARWIGSLLAQLTHAQIRDAFRAGGYSSADIEAYAAIVEKRIAELAAL